MGCWVNDYPRGCVDDCISEELGWLYGSGPIFFALIFLIINNLLVYLHVRKVFQTTEVVDTSRILRQKIQKREVATQGLFYVFTFFFCYSAAIAIRAIEAFSNEPVDENNIYWLLMIQSVTLPLQGFLNMFVYNRPNYKRVRAAYPDLSFLAAIRMACLDPKIPKLTEISQSNSRQLTSTNKYRSRDRSGKNFSSNLQNIEEGDEDDGSEDEEAIDRAMKSLRGNLQGNGEERARSGSGTVREPHDRGARTNTGDTTMADYKDDGDGSLSETDVQQPGSYRIISMDGSLRASNDNDEL